MRDTDELLNAVKNAQLSTTLLLEDGEYRLTQSVDITTSDLVLAGRSGHPARVVLRGEGMNERRVGVAISISAPRVTIADLTIERVGYHGVQIRGERGASHVVLHDIQVIDTGQQLVKGSTVGNGIYADGGLIACSVFAYTNHAPSDYTNGIDILAGKDWIVRDNRFERIRGPAEASWKAGPAILFWANSQDTRVERNLLIDCYRGIAFGLGPGISRYARDHESSFDHERGTIRGNVIVNRNDWADEGIEASAASDVEIEGNRVLTRGGLPWSISLRFPSTTATVSDNVTNRAIVQRDGARATLRGNVITDSEEGLPAPGI